MRGRQNIKLVKWLVDKKQLDDMVCWKNDKWQKWKVEKMKSKNGKNVAPRSKHDKQRKRQSKCSLKLAKWQMDKMTNTQNGK